MQVVGRRTCLYLCVRRPGTTQLGYSRGSVQVLMVGGPGVHGAFGGAVVWGHSLLCVDLNEATRGSRRYSELGLQWQQAEGHARLGHYVGGLSSSSLRSIVAMSNRRVHDWPGPAPSGACCRGVCTQVTSRLVARAIRNAVSPDAELQESE